MTDIFQSELRIPSEEPVLMLAPLEGVTTAPVRKVFSSIGGMDMTTTEFIRLTPSIKKIQPLERLENTQLQIQIMGASTEDILSPLERLKKQNLILDNDWLDLNAGCPSKHVTSSGAGSALLTRPATLVEICQELRKLHKGPLSLKCRTGFTSTDEFPILLNSLKKLSLDFITIHPRSRKQFYGGKVSYESLKKASRILPYPVIGNGDINTAEKAVEVFDSTGIRGIMCGRGALSNPWLFQEIRELFSPSGKKVKDDNSKKIQLLDYALKIKDILAGEEIKKNINCSGAMKEYCVWLSKNPLLGKDFFEKIKRLQSLSKIEQFIKEY